MAFLPHIVPPGSIAATLGEAFRNVGRELWLVGGAVRDELLGNAQPDLDFATDAHPDEITKLLGPLATALHKQGERFGTIGATIGDRHIEITTYRDEFYDPASRKPDVFFASDIDTDLSRRDFTVNAIAVNASTGELHDPFGGVKDLTQRILKTPKSPEQAFSDDPLRMLRALRFAAVLGFKAEAPLLLAVIKMAERLQIVSAERIRDELSKLLVAPKPSIGLNLLVKTGLAAFVLPELPALAMEQDPIHRHKDVLAHTFAVTDNVEGELVSRLGALLHDIAKPSTREIAPDGVSFHHHEVVGARMARVRLEALRYPSGVIDEVAALVFLHLRFHTYSMGWTDSAVRRYVRDAGKLLGKLNGLVRADCTTRNKTKAKALQQRMDELERRIDELKAQEEMDNIRPSIDGFDVMAYFALKPSRKVGEALDYMLEVRINEGELDKVSAYELLGKWGRENDLDPACSVEESIAKADETRPTEL